MNTASGTRIMFQISGMYLEKEKLRKPLTDVNVNFNESTIKCYRPPYHMAIC